MTRKQRRAAARQYFLSGNLDAVANYLRIGQTFRRRK